MKSVIKENAGLKNENKKLKKKITSIKSITTLGNVDTNIIRAWFYFYCIFLSFSIPHLRSDRTIYVN